MIPNMSAQGLCSQHVNSLSGYIFMHIQNEVAIEYKITTQMLKHDEAMQQINIGISSLTHKHTLNQYAYIAHYSCKRV